MLWNKTSGLAPVILLRFGGRQKWLFVLLLAGALAELIAGQTVAAAALLLVGLLLLIPYRCPSRTVPEAAPVLLAPLDGLVEVLETETDDPLFGRQGSTLSFSPGRSDSRVIRSPVTGRLVSSEPGRGIVFEDSAGNRVGLTAIAGELPGRAKLGPVRGDEVDHGAVIGYLPSGETLQLVVPQDSGYAPVMTSGELARAGESVACLRQETHAANVVIDNSR